jgi:hypothetical protein
MTGLGVVGAMEVVVEMVLEPHGLEEERSLDLYDTSLGISLGMRWIPLEVDGESTVDIF